MTISPLAIAAMAMVGSGLKMLASARGIDLDDHLGRRWLTGTKNAPKEPVAVEIR